MGEKEQMEKKEEQQNQKKKRELVWLVLLLPWLLLTCFICAIVFGDSTLVDRIIGVCSYSYSAIIIALGMIVILHALHCIFWKKARKWVVFIIYSSIFIAIILWGFVIDYVTKGAFGTDPYREVMTGYGVVKQTTLNQSNKEK